VNTTYGGDTSFAL